MNIRTICLVSVSVVLLTFLIPQPLDAFFYDGINLVKKMREYEKAEAGDRDTNFPHAWAYRSYVIGVCDATDFMYDIPSEIVVGQICAIVLKFLNEHPERWSEPARDLIIEALKQAFPKKR